MITSSGGCDHIRPRVVNAYILYPAIDVQVIYSVITVLNLLELSIAFFFICRDFLDPDLNRTKIIIAYIRPLLTLENAQLEEFITRF